MYDLEETIADNDCFWSRIRAALARRGQTDLPIRLTRAADPYPLWRCSGLVLGQTCGYPLATTLVNDVRYVGAPSYSARGCEAGRYRSWLIVRERDPAERIEDLRGRRLVINGVDSLSGCKVLESMIPGRLPLDTFFSCVEISGAHLESIARVAGARADLAAIDCVTWSLLERHRPRALRGIRILAAGPALPALPFITSKSTTDAELDDLRATLTDAVRHSPDSRLADRLLLVDVDTGDAGLDAYRNLPKLLAGP